MDARKGRALLERLYLLEAKCLHNVWSFVVRGSSGKNYDIVISSKVSCSCFDCKQRRRICKHIYFIIGRVAQNKELLVQLGDNLNVNLFALDPLLANKINNRINGPKNTIVADSKTDHSERDKTCSICYEDTVEASSVDARRRLCKLCNNVFHSECINIWISRNPTCPLCRNTWVDINETDELAYFSNKN